MLHRIRTYALVHHLFSTWQTEITTSKNKCFNLITFIDTPGLVDGSFQYPFPVEVGGRCCAQEVMSDPSAGSKLTRACALLESQCLRSCVICERNS